MCGIAGILNTGDEQLLHTMKGAIAHRGPDDEGVKWFAPQRSGLANQRLAILDLSAAGHQPMTDDTGNYWITYNGELYNFMEIRRALEQKGVWFKSNSDTEVVLKAYIVWGEGCLQRFNGMFAFAIYDVQKKSLFAARDRLGVKPFYYTRKGAAFAFASEVKAILPSRLYDWGPDYFSLHTPTRYQISPHTGFEHIMKLPPGHCLEFDGQELTIRSYWSIHPEEDRSTSEEVAAERLDWLLNDAVRLQMTADVPVGIFLSGGLDSSIIAALMRNATNQRIHSFTIKFSGRDQKFERMVDDSVYAREVALRFGFLYSEIEIAPDVDELLPKMVWHLDEPLADPAAINTYLISQAARDINIVVLLNGMGGDEIFGGYRKHLACLKADVYQTVAPEIVRRSIERISEAVPVATSRKGLKLFRWGKRFLSFASLPPLERFLVSDLSLSERQYDSIFVNGARYRDTHFYKCQKGFLNGNDLSYLTRMCLSDTLVFLPEHNLTYTDKASMAASVETRPPLTDHRIVEFMFSLPPEFRIHGNTQKYLLKKVSERYLPKHIVHRPKGTFGSPLRSWIRGPLAETVNDLLSEESIRKRGLYDPAHIRRLIDNDRKGLEDNAHVIWTFLTTEVWFRTFFK